MGKNKSDKLLKTFGTVCSELREIANELKDLNQCLESEIGDIRSLLRLKDAELFALKKELSDIRTEHVRMKEKEDMRTVFAPAYYAPSPTVGLPSVRSDKKNADITDIRHELYELIKKVDSVILD